METVPSRVDATSTPNHEERAAMEMPEDVVEDVRR
jgi:hypothetical protein